MVSIEYLAGFFDGEGFVSVYRRTTGHSYRVMMGITNTNREIIDLWNEAFPGTIHTHDHKKHGRTWRDVHLWEADGSRAVGYLSKLSPHLHVKKEETHIALDFFKWYSERPKRLSRVLNQNEINKAETVMKELKKFKAVSWWSK